MSVEALIQSRFALTVAGHELSTPFAGIHGAQAACETIRSQLKREFGTVKYEPHQNRCFAAAGETCVHAITHLHAPMKLKVRPTASEIWWFLKARFEVSRLTFIPRNYHIGNVCRLLGVFGKTKSILPQEIS